MKDIRVESYQYIHVLYATLRYLVSFASSFLSRNNQTGTSSGGSKVIVNAKNQESYMESY